MFNNYSGGNKEGFFQSLKIRLLVLLLVIFVAFAGFHFFRTKHKQSQISKEVFELQKQIDEFERKNKNLEQLAGYLQTDDFKEKEAKEKLNLVKEGEKVIIVKRTEIEKMVEESQEEGPKVKIDRPNYYYWWHYFFGIEPETSSVNSYK